MKSVPFAAFLVLLSISVSLISAACSDYETRSACLLESGAEQCAFCSSGCCLAVDNSTRTGDACHCPGAFPIWAAWVIGVVLLVCFCSCIGYAIYHFCVRTTAPPVMMRQQAGATTGRPMVFIMTQDGQLQPFDPNVGQTTTAGYPVNFSEDQIVQGTVWNPTSQQQEMQPVNNSNQHHPAAAPYGHVIPGFAPPLPTQR
jgi:hypothetical protein